MTRPRHGPLRRGIGTAGDLLWPGLLLAGLAACGDGSPSGPPPPDGDPPTDSVLLVGAGDIAEGIEGPESTAGLLDSLVALDPAAVVFTTGDNAYPDGSEEDFREFYEPTWGRHRERTRPSPGNHDYETPGASAYFAYFSPLAGPDGRGYYSYDLGSDWHVVSLDSNIAADAGGPQERWLRDDLADAEARGRTCTVAYFHHPPRSSGSRHGSDPVMEEIVRALHDFEVEIVLAGHDHSYERFAELDPEGNPADGGGIRHFVVGTGGAGLRGFGDPLPGSEARHGDSHGVLVLTLFDDRYRWEFVAVSDDFEDAGTGECR